MRVVPAEGMVLRDYRTRRFIDPDLGVEIPADDTTFAWLLQHGDAVELSDADYQAALARAEAKAAEPPAAPQADPPPAADPPAPASKSKAPVADDVAAKPEGAAE